MGGGPGLPSLRGTPYPRRLRSGKLVPSCHLLPALPGWGGVCEGRTLCPRALRAAVPGAEMGVVRGKGAPWGGERGMAGGVWWQTARVGWRSPQPIFPPPLRLHLPPSCSPSPSPLPFSLFPHLPQTPREASGRSRARQRRLPWLGAQAVWPSGPCARSPPGPALGLPPLGHAALGRA